MTFPLDLTALIEFVSANQAKPLSTEHSVTKKPLSCNRPRHQKDRIFNFSQSIQKETSQSPTTDSSNIIRRSEQQKAGKEDFTDSVLSSLFKAEHIHNLQKQTALHAVIY